MPRKQVGYLRKPKEAVAKEGNALFRIGSSAEGRGGGGTLWD